MEQRDYIEKQIDQLGRLLAKLLSDMLGQKQNGQINESIENAQQVLKNELNIDLDKLVSMPSDQFIDKLKTEMN